eukprot:14719850-Ditylum_brightwellii.AAC.1
MMTFCKGQQVLVKVELKTLSWYITNLASNMQWIPATVTKMSDTNQTVNCIVSHHPYNKHLIVIGTWHNYHCLDFANVMSLEGDKAAGF